MSILISFPLPSDRHQLKPQDHRYGVRVSCGMPVYSPAFACTQ